MSAVDTLILPPKAPPGIPAAAPLFLVAMPDGPGLRLASRTCRAFQELAPGVRPAVYPSPELGALLSGHATARFTVFVDSPVDMVARTLCARGSADTERALEAWREHARALLRSVQAAPLRCLCFDVAEAESAGAALAGSLSRWLALKDPLPAPAPGEAHDGAASAMARMLAQAVVSDSAETVRLMGELMACCSVLASVDAPAVRTGSTEAIRDYLGLLEQAGEAASRSGVLQAELARSTAELDAARKGLAAAGTEADELLTHLQQARERLARHGDLQTQLARTTVERDVAHRDLAAAREESSELLRHLHLAQEQLEHYFESCQALESVGVPGLVGTTPRASQIQCVSSHDHPPHRHRHFRLEGVQLRERVIPAIEVRLVEHVGRPGLALFKLPGNAAPISAWQASGNEGDKEFMLFIPGDPEGRTLLQPLGSGDWELVAGLAALMQRHTVRTDPTGPDWAAVANRLCRALIDLPPRLRYDRVTVEPSDLNDGPALRVRFENVLFGAIGLEELLVLWRPQPVADGHRPLVWQLGRDVATIPLSIWPADDKGGLRPGWPLPLGSALTPTDKRREWSSLSAFDRDFTLALIDALPAAARLAPQTAMPPHETSATLARQAAAYHKDARRLVASLAWRASLRRLLRAGGHRK